MAAMTRIVRRGLAACFLPGVHGRGVGLSSSRPRATIYHDRAAWDMGVNRRRAGPGHRDASLSRPGVCCASARPPVARKDSCPTGTFCAPAALIWLNSSGRKC